MDIYSPGAMRKAVRSMKIPKVGILDKWFKLVQTEESEEIHFDVEIGKRKVAPFVAPNEAGVINKRVGFKTNTFTPAYVKPKTALRPADALKRIVGETLDMPLTNLERRAVNLADTLQDHTDQILRRVNLMAVEAMISGTCTVSGPGFPTQTVDYGRDAALTAVLTGSDRWSETTSTPLDDLDEMADIVHDLEGVDVPDIVMDRVAASWFKKNKQVLEILDVRRAAGNPSAEMGGLGLADAPNGMKFLGNFGTYNVWVYSDFYDDPDTGESTPVLPAGTVIAASDALEGVRAFGAIMDEDAGIQAMDIFHKSFVTDDPSVRYLLSQSAPLAVPTRPNASFSMKVIS